MIIITLNLREIIYRKNDIISQDERMLNYLYDNKIITDDGIYKNDNNNNIILYITDNTYNVPPIDEYKLNIDDFIIDNYTQYSMSSLTAYILSSRKIYDNIKGYTC